LSGDKTKAKTAYRDSLTLERRRPRHPDPQANQGGIRQAAVSDGSYELHSATGDSAPAASQGGWFQFRRWPLVPGRGVEHSACCPTGHACMDTVSAVAYARTNSRSGNSSPCSFDRRWSGFKDGPPVAKELGGTCYGRSDHASLNVYFGYVATKGLVHCIQNPHLPQLPDGRCRAVARIWNALRK